MKIFGLACLAAVNPKLLGVDLILMGNRRPRPAEATHGPPRKDGWVQRS
jgi:hypothetical protein